MGVCLHVVFNPQPKIVSCHYVLDNKVFQSVNKPRQEHETGDNIKLLQSLWVE